MITKVGLYGGNGHQIQNLLVNHPAARLVAVAAMPDFKAPEGVKQCGSLDELLAEKDIELVSLCSPRRADQAGEAIRSLRAGKHVFAEKPCAMSEKDLDAILSTVQETGRHFHEMHAETMLFQPYREMKRQIQAGTIGTVVQVVAQKCYPWADWRPQDEAVDGGLSTQVGVYIARFTEHIACLKITSLDMIETRLGNPKVTSDCRMAVSMILGTESGAVVSGSCNYLNPMKERCWGYEILRVFGTKGIIESCTDGKVARLILNGQSPQDLDLSVPTVDFFDVYLKSLQEGEPMPLSLEEELRPTRWVVRAKSALKS